MKEQDKNKYEKVYFIDICEVMYKESFGLQNTARKIAVQKLLQKEKLSLSKLAA